MTFLLSTKTEWKYIWLETQKNKNFEIYEDKDSQWKYKIIEYFKKERKEIDPITWTYKETEEITKNRKLVCDRWDFIVKRHIDENVNIDDMYKILKTGKMLFDNTNPEKHIRFVISSSRLFDRDFNDFWMKEREKKDNTAIPKRVKILNTLQEKKYWGYLPMMSLASWEYVDRFIRSEKNSLTDAIKKYGSKNIKDWWSFIDLEKL